jgi:transcriptional regulator with XRE-family HTH domain
MLIDSKKIEVFRIRLRLSRPELAKKAGLSKAQMYNIEREGRTSEESLGKLADALSVPIDSLLPTMAEAVHEDQLLYGEHARDVYALAMAKARRAALSDEELKQLGGVIGQVVDILTIEDPEERARTSPLIVGAINLYHGSVFRPGGRELGEKSFPSTKRKSRRRDTL